MNKEEAIQKLKYYKVIENIFFGKPRNPIIYFKPKIKPEVIILDEFDRKYEEIK